MHYVHAILVKFDKAPTKKQLENVESMADFENAAHTAAVEETEGYGDGDVFDWRTEEDAGRWSDVYPHVLLGAVDSERFMKEYDHFRVIPMDAARKQLQRM